MNVEELLQRLDHVRRRGKGWIARCPAHNLTVGSALLKPLWLVANGGSAPSKAARVTASMPGN
jgi:hypothetical protein